MSSIAENAFRKTAQLSGWQLFLSLATGQWSFEPTTGLIGPATRQP